MIEYRGRKYLTTKEAAEHMGVAVRTVEMWRYRGKGPKYRVLDNRRCGYLVTELDEYVRARAYKMCGA